MVEEKLLQKQVEEYELTRRIFAVKTLQILERTLAVKARESPLDSVAIASLGAAMAAVLNIHN
jgi:hypothetical protein